jgi:hypothetical protein
VVEVILQKMYGLMIMLKLDWMHVIRIHGVKPFVQDFGQSGRKCSREGVMVCRPSVVACVSCEQKDNCGDGLIIQAILPSILRTL